MNLNAYNYILRNQWVDQNSINSILKQSPASWIPVGCNKSPPPLPSHVHHIHSWYSFNQTFKPAAELHNIYTAECSKLLKYVEMCECELAAVQAGCH